MKQLTKLLPQLLNDIKNSTSHSIAYLLSDNVADCLSASGIFLRKLGAPVLRKFYKKYIRHKIITDCAAPLPKNKNGHIFAINHQQKDDIIIAMHGAGAPGYVLFGGLDIALETGNGLGLWAYGTILIDRNSKTSRKSAYEKMKYVLQHGGNIFVYPEGYWNIADDGEMDEFHGADSHNSDSWLVQNLNMGIFRLSQETGCDIVPVILHYDDTSDTVCYTYRDDPFTVSPTDDVFERKDRFTTIMNTAYYNLIEKYSSYSRHRLEAGGLTLKQQNDLYIRQLLDETAIQHTGYKMDMASEKRIGKARTKQHVVTAREAFAHMKNIKPTVKNAFLFRKD